MTTTASPAAAGLDLDATLDAFLGDRLHILQPKHGYRAGVDAVLLAATVGNAQTAPATVLDCGAGVGTVGLCVAARCPNVRVTLVEREPELIDLAHRNVLANALAARVTVLSGDLTAPAADLAAPRLAPDSFDIVLANPPFHTEGAGTRAHNPLKQAAHAMQVAGLDGWMKFAARMARPGGRLTVIHKADALPELLEAVCDRFGALRLTPVHAYADMPAIRILLSGIKGSRAPLVVGPPFVLHAPGGAFTPHASRILREGAALDPSPHND